MLTINLSFGSHLGYQNEFVELHGNQHELTVAFSDGTHTIQSENFDIGIFHTFEGRRILGHLTFKYNYDEERKVITICGTDYNSSDTMYLTTAPDGTSEYCHQRVTPGGFAADDLMANPHWNYHTPLMPGLEDVLRGMARSANESLIAALESVPGLIVQIRKHLPELSSEQYIQLLTVYRDKKFLGLYEKGRDYGPHDTVVTIESVFGGEVKLQNGETFANVIGSTNDPRIAGLTWIQLWAKQFGPATICTSYNFNGFSCSDSLVGGHVIGGKVASTVPAGSDSVYIFPICVKHNNDDRVYMAALKYLKGIWLRNYLGS